jgi:hypothetical protein
LSALRRFCYDGAVKLFWPVYLSVFVVGSAGVYLAAPWCRPYIAPYFGHSAARTLAGTDTVQEAPANSEPSATDTGAPAAQDTPALEPDATPAQKGVFMASANSNPDWGITAQQTSYYKLDGTRVGLVAGGSAFHYRETVFSSRGEMVKGQFFAGSLTNGVFLVGKNDVHLFTGAYTALTPRQCADLRAYYELRGKIVHRQNELILAAASKNPFFPAYHAAYEAYTAHLEKARLLSKQRERATNLERTQIEDKLHEMKHAEIQLKTDCEAAHQKFSAWKTQHAGSEPVPENDPSIRQWQKDMLVHQSNIPGLAM